MRVAISLLLLAVCASASAASGRIIKVLPHLLDLQGRHALSPSLYDRDAYQAYLREHPEKQSGIRFDVEWSAKAGPEEALKLLVEVRGISRGDLPERESHSRCCSWSRRNCRASHSDRAARRGLRRAAR